MYLRAKLILITITLLITGLFFYIFRSHIPPFSLMSKSVESTSPEIKPVIPEDKDSPQKEEKPTKKGNKDSSPGSSSLQKKIIMAQEMFQKEDLLNARKIAENMLVDPKLEPYGSDWMKVAELVSEINTQFLFSDMICPEKITYIVEKNDSLVKIANQFKTTITLIQKSNQLDSTNSMIYPGQAFRIFKADWNIKVIKNLFLLILSDKDRLVKIYKVGTGRQDRTPVGTFNLDLKEFEPDWWQPGKLVKFGDPGNVLGTRWMSLSPIENTNPSLRGYGIHGTWEPESIGHAASKGCIRMVNDQVEELYDIVPVGTRVEIVD